MTLLNRVNQSSDTKISDQEIAYYLKYELVMKDAFYAMTREDYFYFCNMIKGSIDAKLEIMKELLNIEEA